MAKGSSRRVPRKNIKPLGGKPLITWTIEEAKKANSLDGFLVSTDDDEIAEISRNAGASVPFKRPSELSEDKDGKETDSSWVLKHALEWYEQTNNKRVSHIVCLQPTSPFRTADDINSCIQIAKQTNADTVISVCKAKQNPFWCFEFNSVSQQLRSFMDIPLQGDNLISQNLPLILYPNGAIYVTRRDWILNGRIYGEKIFGFLMPEERSVDIDDELDFIICNALIEPLKKNEGVWAKISWLVS